MAAFPAVEELLPHRGSMLLIDEVLSHEPDSIVTGATVSPEGMPAWMGLELMAQAAAACAGMEARRGGRIGQTQPRGGMLVGCRAYRATSPSLPGGVLHVAARRTATDEGFSIFDCSVSTAGGDTLATGKIQVLLEQEKR
jgi:predicted hotdog family 3-hydroxylacyl-ACP dehydratase